MDYSRDQNEYLYNYGGNIMPENEEMKTPTPEEVLVNMRENMVPKEEAQKWQEKYNQLFQSVANGTFEDNSEPQYTEEDFLNSFNNALSNLSNTDKSLTDKEVIENLLIVDDYNRHRTGRSIFSNPKERDDGSSDEVRSFLETAVAQESDAQLSAWTTDHLDFNRF